MHDHSLYDIWAPDNALWTDWAKPVLFASMDAAKMGAMHAPLAVPHVVGEMHPHTAVIVDMAGAAGVAVAMAFAKKGYRPVPLYNGVMGSGQMLVDVRAVAVALAQATETLADMRLLPDAPPVFMLDSSRMKPVGLTTDFDNRWCVFPQDMPSAQFLQRQGIERVDIVSDESLRTDLNHVLFTYQKQGLSVRLTKDLAQPPQHITIAKRGALSLLGYRLSVILGLRRNSTGGFGGVTPYYGSGSGMG